MPEAIAISPLLTGAQIIARIGAADGTGSGLDADTIRGEGPLGTPAIPGGTSGIPLFGQIFQPARQSPYPASLFKV